MVDNLQEARVFTDIHGLQALKRLGKNNSPEALKEVSRQFESFFLNTLLKSIRSANDILAKDNYTSSNDVQFYQQSLDQQLSLELSKENGTGLAELIYQQLSRQFADHLPMNIPDSSNAARETAMPTYEKSTIETVVPDSKEELSPSELLAQNIIPLQASSASAQLERISERLTTVDEPLELSSKDHQVAGDQLTESTDNGRSFFDNLDFSQTPFSFVNTLYKFAKTAAQRIGLDPKVLLAQSALETGWGKYVVQKPDGQSSHNLFGIKADQRWGGEKAIVRTLEYRDGVAQKERAAFRSYESFEKSFDDYIDFLQANDRYKNAISHTHDAQQYTRELQVAGYATDPAYAEKIQRILSSDILNDAVQSTVE